MRIAYQGAPGAYSYLAATSRVPGSRTVGLPDFGGVMTAVAAGKVDAGIIPVYNTIVGPVTAATELLGGRDDLEVVEEFEQRIAHCLLALPGADLAGIRWVESHPVALAQCTRWLSSRQLAPRPVEDTAGAARDIAADRDWTRAAIAPAEAAERYGLEVLARDIADSPDNRTRFVLVVRRAGRQSAAA